MSSINEIITKRRIIALVLILVIAIPTTILVHAELSYGDYSKEPTHSVQVHSPKDIWYPRNGNWQPYPVLVTGNISSYFSRPYLMYPSDIEVEFLMKDATNLSTDLSWLSVADYAVIPDGGKINVTLNPNVSGDYGDNENYAVNQSEWVNWHSHGLPLIPNSTGAGISGHDIDMTGHLISSYYSFCKVKLSFGQETSLRSLNWSLLLEIAILREDASLIAGHWMELIVTYTITWVPILVFRLIGSNTYSDTIVRGDGLPDMGVVDYTFYMLEGDVTLNRN